MGEVLVDLEMMKETKVVDVQKHILHYVIIFTKMTKLSYAISGSHVAAWCGGMTDHTNFRKKHFPTIRILGLAILTILI